MASGIKRSTSLLSPNGETTHATKSSRKETSTDRIAILEKSNDHHITEIFQLRQDIKKHTSKPTTIQNPVLESNKTNNQNTNKNEKTKSIKLIIKNSGIKNATIESLTANYLIDTKITSAKQSKMNPETIITEINLCDINKAINKNNWKGINDNTIFMIDKYSKYINTLCVNKIKLHDESILSLNEAYESLKKINSNIYNIRYNRTQNPNLIIFETELINTKFFVNAPLNIQNLNTRLNIREFDCVDDYITKCYKCQKFGHIQTDCKGNSKCGRCNKEKCNYQCKKEDALCANCGEKHSSNYRGCAKYKEEIERAQEKKKKLTKDKEIKKIGIIERDMIGIAPAIQKSYAETLKNQSTLEEINKKLKKLELEIEKNKLELSILKRDTQNYVKIEEMYQIMYETIWGSINQACDTPQELRYCIQSTIKDRFSKFSSSITNILNKTEKNSILFAESFNRTLRDEDLNG